MNTLLNKLIPLLLCVVITLPLFAQQHTAGIPAGKNKTNHIQLVSGKEIQPQRLDAFIQHTMDSLQIPGLSIALINDKQVVYQRAFGVTNLESREPVTEQTLFEAASLSKPIFAYFAMKMVEEGLLELDKPMKEYLPHPGIDSASLAYYALVTPRTILAHSAGFPNWSNGEKITIAFKPGTGYAYSGEAYQYLAAAIGMKLGVGFKAGLDSVFQQEIAEPLGLEHSYFTWNDYTAKHKAYGHQEGKPTDNQDQGKAFGAGYSLHTNAADYARFLIEMMQPNYLSRNLRDEMLAEQNKFKADNALLETGQTGWGLGFARRPTDNGLRYMHTGNNHDFQSYTCFYPDSGYGLVFFINSDQIEPFYAALGKFLEDEF